MRGAADSFDKDFKLGMKILFHRCSFKFTLFCLFVCLFKNKDPGL